MILEVSEQTLHRFNQIDRDNIKNYLSNCELLLRVFKTTESNNIKNKIAEYTNSQNAISNIDLKSLSSEQILIEQFLDENNIIYARKIGDTGISSTKSYIHKISMEKFGQILFSILGFPEKASNQKKEIFDKYYNQIFGDNFFDLSKSAEYVKRYYEVKKVYETSRKNYEVTDQKIFYVLYMDNKVNKSIVEKIEIFEKILNAYSPSGNAIPNARKLIQLRFREYFDMEVKKYN